VDLAVTGAPRALVEAIWETVRGVLEKMDRQDFGKFNP